MIFSDNNKIGMFLVLAGVCSYFLGCLMLFDRSLLLLGNLCFVAGIFVLTGAYSGVLFFTGKGKLVGSLYFLAGFIIIIARWSFVGGLVQLFGLYGMFKSFLPFLFDYLMSVPVIGPFLSKLSRVQPAVQQSVRGDGHAHSR